MGFGTLKTGREPALKLHPKSACAGLGGVVHFNKLDRNSDYDRHEFFMDRHGTNTPTSLRTTISRGSAPTKVLQINHHLCLMLDVLSGTL